MNKNTERTLVTQLRSVIDGMAGTSFEEGYFEGMNNDRQNQKNLGRMVKLQKKLDILLSKI